MQYIEALAPYNGHEKSVFLAGGISNCIDWQAEVTSMLADANLVLLNPRRSNFPIYNPAESEVQIKWEFDHLRKASAILFWFPSETLCPITLYELGTWSMTEKPLFVGVHPNYQRRSDVEIQTRLVRPDVTIVYTIAELVKQVWVYAAAIPNLKP